MNELFTKLREEKTNIPNNKNMTFYNKFENHYCLPLPVYIDSLATLCISSYALYLEF